MFWQEAKSMNEATPDRSDRRRSRRQSPKPTTEVACRAETLVVGSNLALSVLDISADGIRLMVNRSLDKGQKIEVDLEGIGYCQPLKLAAEVVWSLETADGKWCIGARF
jgi:PilZ domain